MADTFGQVWRVVRNHVPLAPATLCQYWVQTAYTWVCDQRPWSWLRSEAEFLINDAKSGTVTVNRGSDTVTGVGLTFASSDVGRQLRVSSNNTPVYTISAVDTGANTATLERVFGDTSVVATTATVGDWFLTCPTDFQRFMCVLDTHNNWQLHLWVTEEEINAWDAQRSASGTPWALVSRRMSTLTSTDGRAQYEIWPYPQTARNYPFFYIRRPEVLTDDTAFKGPLAQNGNILVDLALAEAAAWPGLEDRRNPYYNPVLSNMKRAEATKDAARMEVLDEDMYPTWWETMSWVNRYPYAPIDSKYFQNHDVGYQAPWGATWPH